MIHSGDFCVIIIWGFPFGSGFPFQLLAPVLADSLSADSL
jgi:hypothetical protein